MCRVFFWIVGRGCVLWSVHSLGKTLLAFALIHSVFQSQISRYYRYWLCTLAFHSLMMKRTSLFLALVLEGLVSLHRTIQLLQYYWLGHKLNSLPWKRTDIILSFLRLNTSIILGTLVDYEGYSISPEGLLSTVLDTMFILIKFTHSSPF